MDLKDIKGIVELMKKNSLSEFELEKDDFKIRLKRGWADVQSGATQTPDDQLPLGYLIGPSGGPPEGVSGQGKGQIPGQMDITSPMIGTFYRSGSPESPAFVEVGTHVDPETVVCIIEAMKVMNEIKAETKGVITQIMVENAKPVEFGQPLFKVRPAP